MTECEARDCAIQRMFTAIAHVNDYDDDDVKELINEAVLFITEGTIQALKDKNYIHPEKPYIRVKSMPEVRQKGWDDAIQAAVRVCDERIKDLGRGIITDVVEELREEIRALGG